MHLTMRLPRCCLARSCRLGPDKSQKPLYLPWSILLNTLDILGLTRLTLWALHCHEHHLPRPPIAQDCGLSVYHVVLWCLQIFWHCGSSSSLRGTCHLNLPVALDQQARSGLPVHYLPPFSVSHPPVCGILTLSTFFIGPYITQIDLRDLVRRCWTKQNSH